jgi:hypothetical protein
MGFYHRGEVLNRGRPAKAKAKAAAHQPTNCFPGTHCARSWETPQAKAAAALAKGAHEAAAKRALKQAARALKLDPADPGAAALKAAVAALLQARLRVAHAPFWDGAGGLLCTIRIEDLFLKQAV